MYLMARRAKARRTFLEYCSFIDKSFQSPPHIQLLAKKLEAVLAGKLKKLMIFMPPRHGKSYTASELFPSYALGKYPFMRIMLTSYGQTLADSFSKNVRDLIEDKRHCLLFGRTVRRDDRRVDNWRLQGYRGGMLSAGVGASITGFGTDLLIIDDPVKNREEAESKVYRDKTYEWYKSVARTRLEPHASQIIIMTRWHKQDLAGSILADQKDWEVIHLKAISDDGHALWPARYDIKALEDIQFDVGSRTWNALFQGEPMAPETQIIKREWIQYFDVLPIRCYRGCGIDTATSKKTTADYMSCVDAARDVAGYINIDNVFLDRLSVRSFSQWLLNRHKGSQYSNVQIEDNNAGYAIRQDIELLSRELKIDIPIKGFTTSTDKVIRVHEIAPLIENGTIKFKRGDKRVEALIDHLCEFPQGTIDDDVDALYFAVKAVQSLSTLNDTKTESESRPLVNSSTLQW